MATRVPLPEGLDTGAFRVSDAIALGVGRSRLDNRDLSAPFWGIRSAAPSTDTLLSLCAALSQRMPGPAFFSHLTAAQLLQIPLPAHLERAFPIHVGIAPPKRAMDAKNVVGHRLSLQPGDLVTWNGMRLTSPSRTWLDLATVLTPPDLVAAGDFLVRRRHGVVSVADLQDAAARFGGRRGRTTFRAALPLLRDGAESRRESLLRVIIVQAGLPEPLCNLNVYAPDGRFIARPDLLYPRYKVIVEYHGDQHRTDLRQWRRDIQRNGDLEDHGWKIVQFTMADLDTPAALIARIRTRLRASGWR